MCDQSGYYPNSWYYGPQTLQHIYGSSPEPIKIKVEKNSKGYNWEVSVAGASVDEILSKIAEADAKLKAAYGVVE